MDAEAQAVLSFWLGPLDQDGMSSKDHAARWFTRSSAFDDEIRQRFGDLHRAVANGEREGWLEDPHTLVAYVIVLDQFSRNLFRNSPDSFAHDAKAARASSLAVERGDEPSLTIQQRVFLYMPFMHSESLEHQDRCVERFRSLAETAPASCRPVLENNADYAVRHRDIVARFDRFPHRNEVMGRPSTPEEIEFLRQPGSSF
ncbi:MAG: DUF924 domain-containing protein [Polyangiaceae bacterium]|nr:DUF924 domain-containing protein [Polyangiaceae bacterium]